MIDERMENWYNDKLWGKTKVLLEKLVIMPIYPSQILHGLAWNLTQASMART
jgi:hypothetical protein